MKTSTLFRFNPLLLKADAAEGAVATKEEPKPQEKAAGKPDDKPDGKKEDDIAKLSPEELRQKQKQLKDVSRGGRRKAEGKKADENKVEEKPAAKPEDKPAEANGEKKEEKPPVKPPAQPAKKTEPVDVPPPIGEVEPVAKPEGEPELKSKIELRPADKRKLKVLQQMEEDGTAPKGTAEKTLKFWEMEKDYQDRWEQAHPGDEFDENADEHKPFYGRHEVTYDEDEFEISRDNLVRKEALKETEGRQTKEKKTQERVSAFKEAQPKIIDDSHRAVMEMIAEAAPELAELMGNGNERALTKEVTEKMQSKDPVITEILQETAEELAVLTIELHRLTQFDDVYPADVAKPLELKVSGREIYPHARLANFMQGLEAEMLRMDPAQTMRGKQRLVANGAFNNEYQRIASDGSLDVKGKREAVAKLNASYYTLTEEDFRRGLIGQYAAIARKDIEKFTARMGHRTPRKEEAAPVATPEEAKKEEPKEEKEVEIEVNPVQRTRSPSSASSSDVVDPSHKSSKETVTDAKSAVARTRGR